MTSHTVVAAGRCRTCGGRWRTYRPGDACPISCPNLDCPGQMEVVRPGHCRPDAVEAFISTAPGDASHAAVRACALAAQRCLDASSFEANALARHRLEAFYRAQAESRHYISPHMFSGAERFAA